MKVFKDINALPKFKNAVITIGSFDGVHQGHQRIIRKVNQLASAIGGESVIITFHPHPRQIVFPNDPSLALLTTLEEKIELLGRYGAQNLVVAPFTIEFSQLNADEYIQKFIVDKFHPRFVVIGYDHRFGYNRQGDINYLKWHGQAGGFEVIEIEKQEVEAISVSSTRIRKALLTGNMETTAALLGHYFFLKGKVVHGQKIGAKIGFPTANLSVEHPNKQVPPDGIYAVWVWHEAEKLGGMLYIGERPTLKAYQNRTIEVNIFDFEGDLYGQEIKVEFVARIRGDAAFNSLEELKAQLENDEEVARAVLGQPIAPWVKSSSSKTTVAVVILNYNGLQHLQNFLPSVLQSTYSNLEIVVADNASTDRSISWLQATYPEIRIIELKENVGFAAGYNQALRQIKADYYVLLNSDVEVSRDWLTPLVRLMESDAEIAACQPKILSFHHKNKFEYAGAAGGWMDSLGYPFCRGRLFGHTETDEGQYNDTCEIFWAGGAALMVRANLFHELDGFDVGYFAHAEEIDLCWRLKRAGYKIMVAPDSVVYHVGGGTLSYDSPQKVFLNFRNTLFTILKNESIPKLFWLIPLRLVLDGIAGLLFLSQGKYPLITSIFKAHGAFYAHLPAYWQKRQTNSAAIRRASVARPNKAGVFKGSIVWQYFIKGKRTFNQLRLPPSIRHEKP